MNFTTLSTERQPSPGFQRKFAHELAELGLGSVDAPAPILTDADLAPLPAAARRFLQFMEVIRRH